MSPVHTSTEVAPTSSSTSFVKTPPIVTATSVIESIPSQISFPTTDAAMLAIRGSTEVAINFPREGQEFPDDQPVLVQAIVADPFGMTQAQLLVDERIAQTLDWKDPYASHLPATIVFAYSPTEIGSVEFQVRIWRGDIIHRSVKVNAVVHESLEFRPLATLPYEGIIYLSNDTCHVVTNVDINFREAPSTNASRITYLQAGIIATVVGQSADTYWVKVRVGQLDGWLSRLYVSLLGDCSNLPTLVT